MPQYSDWYLTVAMDSASGIDLLLSYDTHTHARTHTLLHPQLPFISLVHYAVRTPATLLIFGFIAAVLNTPMYEVRLISVCEHLVPSSKENALCLDHKVLSTKYRFGKITAVFRKTHSQHIKALFGQS